MKKTILCLLIFSTAFASSWSPFQKNSLNFALPHPYAAKETIITWYQNRFVDSLKEKEQDLIQLIEANTSDPIYCTKLTVGSITTNFCNPWTLAVFIKDGQYYVTHRRYKFFSTLNHMEVLKMNLGLDSYDEFFKVVLPFASDFRKAQLDPSDQLAISFYYIYDYLLNDSCSSYECEDRQRLKKKPTLKRIDEENLSYTWIHRTLLTGCSQGGNCITAREITYQVSQSEPTTWYSSTTDIAYEDAWQGSLIWQKLQSRWVPGISELFEMDNTSTPITIIPLPLKP